MMLKVLWPLYTCIYIYTHVNLHAHEYTWIGTHTQKTLIWGFLSHSINRTLCH